jgi:carbonic anhydrase/acetyltransferase-like protein (isoleucine patch superfamily)
MALYRIGNSTPNKHPAAWVSASAEVSGNVRLEASVSVWFTAVIRGDNEPISIGSRSNVQEGAILHSDPGYPLTIGDDVTVGHRAVLHGCTVGDGSLIGIGAIVLNGARIGRSCIVGAGAVVTEGKAFPDFSIIVGTPARVTKQLSPEQVESLKANAAHYVENARRFKADLAVVEI